MQAATQDSSVSKAAEPGQEASIVWGQSSPGQRGALPMSIQRQHLLEVEAHWLGLGCPDWPAASFLVIVSPWDP